MIVGPRALAVSRLMTNSDVVQLPLRRRRYWTCAPFTFTEYSTTTASRAHPCEGTMATAW